MLWKSWLRYVSKSTVTRTWRTEFTSLTTSLPTTPASMDTPISMSPRRVCSSSTCHGPYHTTLRISRSWMPSFLILFRYNYYFIIVKLYNRESTLMYFRYIYCAITIFLDVWYILLWSYYIIIFSLACTKNGVSLRSETSGRLRQRKRSATTWLCRPQRCTKAWHYLSFRGLSGYSSLAVSLQASHSASNLWVLGWSRSDIDI